MRNLMLLAGVAALSVSLPAVAKDRGGGHGRGQAAQASDEDGSHGPGAQGRGDRGGRGGANVDRGRRGGGDGGREAERRLNPQQRQAERAISQERRLVREARNENRGREMRRARGEARAIEGNRDVQRREVREARVDRRVVREVPRDERHFRDDRRWVREARLDDRRDWNAWARRPLIVRDSFDNNFVYRSPYRPMFVRAGHCPPGLARQNRFCMPPGQLRRARFIGQPMPISAWAYNVPVRYRYRFADDSRYFYRFDNYDTVYRFDRGSGLVSSVIPLTATGLLPGEPLPLGYDVYNVPLAYRDYYRDTDDYLYRYDDNAIYRVNSDNMLVEGIVALLAGGAGGLGGLGIGDMLPTGYDAYNVPLDYRDTYYDTPDSMYHYADGSIYEVDPQTRLIESVISLLV